MERLWNNVTGPGPTGPRGVYGRVVTRVGVDLWGGSPSWQCQTGRVWVWKRLPWVLGMESHRLPI